jgi:hypothetical protein
MTAAHRHLPDVGKGDRRLVETAEEGRHRLKE